MNNQTKTENKRDRKEYFKNYQKEKYNKDKSFREKHKQRMRDYLRNRYNTDEEYRERKKEESRRKHRGLRKMGVSVKKNNIEMKVP